MRPCASSLSEVTYFLHHEAQAQAHSTRQTLHLSIARGSTKSRGARGATSTLYSTRRDAGHKVTESQSTAVTATGPRKNGFPEAEARLAIPGCHWSEECVGGVRIKCAWQSGFAGRRALVSGTCRARGIGERANRWPRYSKVLR